MDKRKFRITFRRYADYNCTIEATTHAKAKMQVAYALMDCKYFARFGDVLKEIEFCQVKERGTLARSASRGISCD